MSAGAGSSAAAPSGRRAPPPSRPLPRVLPPGWPSWCEKLAQRIWHAPVVQFYAYMWRVDRGLVAGTLLANYGVPLLLEALPWYLSRTKISRRLRDSRNAIQHGLVAGRPFQNTSLLEYVVLTLMYAALHTLDQVLSNRVALATRLMTKRLVLERILYSEIGTLQARYQEIFESEVVADMRTEELESRVTGDVSMTLHLFNSIVPSLVRGAVTMVRQASELYQRRDAVDLLAVLRPTVVGVLSELGNEARLRLVEERQYVQDQRTTAEMARVVSNIVDGLPEVQVNNLQRHQLAQLDAVSRRELANKEGLLSFLDRTYRTVETRNVWDFASEVALVRWMARTRNVDHETYRRIQNEIDYIVRLAKRLWGLARQGWTILDTQRRVLALLHLPSFLDEARAHEDAVDRPRFSFQRICIHELRFAYAADAPLVLNVASDIEFERGRSYALVGRNGSGKSTLVKILCKLYSARPDADGTSVGVGSSRIDVDGADFALLPRSRLRQVVTYVAQRPFIFAGTVEENIRSACPGASRAEVEAAAVAAGLLHFVADARRLPDDRAPSGAAPAPSAQSERGVDDEGGDVEFVADANRERRDALLAAEVDADLLAPLAAAPAPARVLLDEDAPAAPASPARPWEEGRRWWRAAAVRAWSRLRPGGNAAEVDAQPTAQAARGPADVTASNQPATIGEALDLLAGVGGANLSGGFAQCVALARVFLRKDSQLLVLDEADSQMDTVKKREWVLPRVLDFAKRHNMACVLISHDLAAVCPLVDRVYVLERGALLLQGSHAELVERRAPEYARLLGAPERPLLPAARSEAVS